MGDAWNDWPVWNRQSGLPGFASTASNPSESFPKKTRTARGRHGAGPGIALACLRVAPGELSGFWIERGQNLLAALAGDFFCARGVESFAFGEFLWLEKILLAVFKGHEVEQSRGWIVGRRKPVN